MIKGGAEQPLFYMVDNSSETLARPGRQWQYHSTEQRAASVSEREIPLDQVPTPKGGVDIRALSIAPEDAFVLSRIDGRTTVKEIHLTTGLPVPRVTQALDTLARLGAIEPLAGMEPQTPTTARSAAQPRIPRPQAAQPASTLRATAASAGSTGSGPQQDPKTSSGPKAATAGAGERGRGTPAPSPRAKRPGSDDAPLSRLQDMLEQADSQDHYQLLGLARSADKQSIKTAYFRLVSDYHPDKYYGTDLGDDKERLEKLFQRLTLAHETLTRSKKRREYDESLPPETEALTPANPSTLEEPETTVAPAEPEPSPVPSGVVPAPPDLDPPQVIIKEAPHSGLSASAPPSKTSAPARFSAIPRTQRSPGSAETALDRPAQSTRVRSVPAAFSAEKRKKQARASVAHHLKGLVERGRGPQSQTAMSSPSTPRSVAGAPPSRSEPNAPATAGGGVAPRPPSSAATSSQVERYVAAADEQLEDNPVAAANALRLALSLSPDDPELQQRLEYAELRSDQHLADSHLVSAKAHERGGHWKAAGKYYAKAARGRQSGELYVLAAQCYRKDPEGLRTAGEQARKAIELDASDPQAHLILAEIYRDAGMPKSAIKVLETAASLQPSDDAIQNLLTQLKRGEN